MGVQELRPHLSGLDAGNQCRPLLDLSAFQDRKSGSWSSLFRFVWVLFQNKSTDVVAISFHSFVSYVFNSLPGMRRTNHKSACKIVLLNWELLR